MRSILGILLLSFLLLGSCAPTIHLQISPQIEEEIFGVYDPWKEKCYCLSLTTGVYSIVEGNIVSCNFPACEPCDIVMHTHPWFGEHFANFADVWAFEDYHEVLGNTLFGVSGEDWYKFYTIEGDKND